MPEAHIGTSGFSYDHWRGAFYPEGLAKGKWFGYYCERFSTVELNVTFYRLPKEETFQKWRSETPDGFKFALKGSRFITHIKRLRDPAEPLKTFMERARILREKLAVILWQLPPNFKKDTERLKFFLKALKKYRRRNVFEFRNESWIDKEVISLIKEEGAGICMADWPPFIDKLPATADFAYIRRHGREGSYATRYTAEELKRDAQRIRKHLREKRDTFIYFNNDAMGYAARNALELKGMLRR
jgi:uncharacterized protein YecE (DUF72 family)